MAGDCGLVCPSEVEKYAESHRSRKSVYDFYGLYVTFGGDGSAVFEIVNGTKRLTATLDPLMVDELFRAMLDELGWNLFGRDMPSLTALYTVKRLSDLAATWLRAAEERRRMLEKRLRELQPRLRKWRELERQYNDVYEKLQQVYRTLDKKCGKDAACRERLWKKQGKDLFEELRRLDDELNKLKLYYEELGYTIEPPEADKRLRKALAEAMEREKRLRLAALALTHAWRALTHPEISDLLELYDYKRVAEENHMLWDYFLKDRQEAKAEARG